MNKAPKKERNREMYEALLSLKNVDEVMKFFDDLCTVTEIVAMEQRFQVAVCLSKGMIYNDILSETGASSATISRVNRSLQYGSGGYDLAFFFRTSKSSREGASWDFTAGWGWCTAPQTGHGFPSSSVSARIPACSSLNALRRSSASSRHFSAYSFAARYADCASFKSRL